ncbi:MAG: hypothetical protein WEA29_07790 [Acidimicrobiia bacterium]
MKYPLRDQFGRGGSGERTTRRPRRDSFRSVHRPIGAIELWGER